jgi:hypothetical protein
MKQTSSLAGTGIVSQVRTLFVDSRQGHSVVELAPAVGEVPLGAPGSSPAPEATLERGVPRHTLSRNRKLNVPGQPDGGFVDSARVLGLAERGGDDQDRE